MEPLGKTTFWPMHTRGRKRDNTTAIGAGLPNWQKKKNQLCRNSLSKIASHRRYLQSYSKSNQQFWDFPNTNISNPNVKVQNHIPELSGFIPCRKILKMYKKTQDLVLDINGINTRMGIYWMVGKIKQCSPMPACRTIFISCISIVAL